MRCVVQSGISDIRPERLGANTTLVRPPRRRLHLALLGLGAVVLLACQPDQSQELRRFNVLPPADLRVDADLDFALSPDGEQLAFVARGVDVVSTIWLQPIGSLEATPLEGTEGGSQPFWSPDGRSLGYFAAEKLWTIDLDDGTTTALAEALIPHGGSWGANGTILFSPTYGEPIHRVPADGGAVEPVGALDADLGELAHLQPSFLPDGRRFVYLSQAEESDDAVEGRSIWIGSLETGATQRVVGASSAARYAESGHLLYLRDQSLWAEGFDLADGSLSGDPTVLVREISPTFRFGTPASVSTTGRLLYRRSTLADKSVLTWVGRDGTRQGTVGEEKNYGTAMLSPDGRRVATSILDPLSDRTDVWIIDLERGTSSRLTLASRDDMAPVWFSDSRRVSFYADFATESGTYARSIDGSTEEELVYSGESFHLLWSISPDDRTGWLLLNNFGSGTRWDVAKLDLETGSAEIFLGGEDRESGPEVSPDGRFLAFHSDRTGRMEVYVVPTDDPTTSHQVSKDGGSHALWARDGSEIVFRGPDGWLFAAPIEVESTIRSGNPVRLFEAGERDGVGNRYSVTRDGERFLLNRPFVTGFDPWVLVENWLLLD